MTGDQKKYFSAIYPSVPTDLWDKAKKIETDIVEQTPYLQKGWTITVFDDDGKEIYREFLDCEPIYAEAPEVVRWTEDNETSYQQVWGKPSGFAIGVLVAYPKYANYN